MIAVANQQNPDEQFGIDRGPASAAIEAPDNDDSAVVANAPSTIGDHSRKRGAVLFRVTGVIFSTMPSAKAEEGRDRGKVPASAGKDAAGLPT